MSSAMGHAVVLRAPWYVLERDQLRWDDAAAARPEVQKYDADDFVARVVADPRDSLTWTADDQLSVTVPVGALPTTTRQLSAYRSVHLPTRKLYQPSHDRFYVVVAELFCDEPGLPRPGAAPGVDLGLVIRRERVALPTLTQDARARIRDLATRAIVAADAAAPRPAQLDEVGAADQLLVLSQATGTLAAEYQNLLGSIGATTVVEAWVMPPGEAGRWEVVLADHEGQLAAQEQEMRMWRVPATSSGCEAARSRSLWFAPVPTSSSQKDADGNLRLDEANVYHIRCFARRQPPAGREHCPPRVWLSERTQQFGLAAFFDPEGTKNHHVRVVTPDFRALQARSQGPRAVGGVELVQPPRSQLVVMADGGTPRAGGIGDGAALSLTLPIELITIVAMFLLQLFLPVVVLLFGLWWMLALRFRWPPDDKALAVLNALQAPGATVGGLSQANKDALDQVIGAKGSADALGATTAGSSHAGSVDLVNSLAPQQKPPPAVETALSRPDDPVCGL